MNELNTSPHRRYNPLTGDWVLVSPHRLQRPWQGRVEQLPGQDRPQYDPKCYLCPGNERAGGHKNPPYAGTFVFDNDFAALLPDAPNGAIDEDGLIVARSERGCCRVICFSPRHDLTLPLMDLPDIRGVVDVWTDNYLELGSRDSIGHVQVFENKGEIMGCSNPHPHCQVWATETMPLEPSREDHFQREYHCAHGGKCLLCTYLAHEESQKERIICENPHWVALVPFWAKWPFEVVLVCRGHAGHLGELDDAGRDGLAQILRAVTTRYDNLFGISFPYTMGFHQAPTDGGRHPHWHLHAHYYPPLLRSATVQKFMVGFEMLGTPQRDITPESAAERLRGLAETHYRMAGGA